MKKTYAYRFLLNSSPPGTLQEGIFEAYHIEDAKGKAQKICREEVIPAEVNGNWSDWAERNGIYGCSFMETCTGRYRFRLMITDVPSGLTEGNIQQLLPT